MHTETVNSARGVSPSALEENSLLCLFAFFYTTPSFFILFPASSSLSSLMKFKPGSIGLNFGSIT